MKGPGYKYVEGAEKPFKCKGKGCGRSFASEGGYNLHACARNEGDKPGRNKLGGGGDCPDCGGEMRLLRKDVSIEKKELDKGRRKVCPKCKEVV